MYTFSGTNQRGLTLTGHARTSRLSKIRTYRWLYRFCITIYRPGIATQQTPVFDHVANKIEPPCHESELHIEPFEFSTWRGVNFLILVICLS